ncbi:MAG: metallophosphoesterase [Candidatus Velthaea sp.]
MQKLMRSLWACAVIAGVVAFGTTPSSAQPPRTERWLLLSDIHLNPFDDPAIVDTLAQASAAQWHDIFEAKEASAPPSGYAKDTNYALLASTLAEMKAVVQNPPVVVIAGDLLAHEFPQLFVRAQPGKPPAAYESFVDKTVAYLALELNAAYPNAQFVVTLGNNDGYCGDYHSQPRSPFLAHMAQAWGPLVNRYAHAPDFIADFPEAGYYTAMLPTQTRAQAVVVNSVFWSAAYQNTCGLPSENPGQIELAWLKAAIAGTPGTYRWFVTHIPPGIDAYSSMRAAKPVPFMDEPSAEALVATMADPQARAVEIIAGHTHHASFEIASAGNVRVPMAVLPSISPVQANNPAFVVADVAPETGIIADFTTYALPLGLTGQATAWTKEYQFSSAYGSTAFDAPNLDKLQTALGTDAALRSTYAAYYTSKSPVGAISAANWAWYWCSDVNLSSAAYAACVARTAPSPAPSASPR